MGSRASALLHSPVSRRRFFMPAVLFVDAFAAVIAFANRDHFPDTDAEPSGNAVVSAPTAAPGVAASPAPSLEKPAAQLPASPAATAAPRHNEPSAEQLQAIEDLKQQVVASTPDAPMEEREERGDAIREVSNLSGPQAVQALIAALRGDSDRRNRILAVEGLRRAAAAGDKDGAIREALREASTSSDEIIAEHAREVYSALAR
jgi:hypothetical protein